MASRLLAGHRPVLEALRGRGRVRKVFLDSHDRYPDVRGEAERRRVAVSTKPRSELDRMTEGLRHQGVVAIADPYPFVELEDLVTTMDDHGVLVALDEITDPHNLGAIVRTAVTLGIDGVIVQKHRAASVTPSVVRASAGATEHASIARVTNLQRSLHMLQQHRAEIIGLDANADTDIGDLQTSHGMRVLVVGSEGKGLRRMVRQRCDIVVQIPQTGPLDSLNASVAAAIAMYELASKRGEATDE